MCNKHQFFQHGHGHNGCSCSCGMKSNFLSKKKRVMVLKQYLADLEDRADDIKEYIKEIESE